MRQRQDASPALPVPEPQREPGQQAAHGEGKRQVQDEGDWRRLAIKVSVRSFANGCYFQAMFWLVPWLHS